MSHTAKLKPNLDAKSTKALNLTVLQRIDPFVEEILLTAAHVTLYGFDVDTSQWSRKDVEGSLFVVKRNTQPRFQFIVMNRRSTDNLVEDLLGDFEYEVQVPYLLYKNASQEVNGIWFYNVHDCDAVSDLLSRILNAYAKVPTKSNTPLTKSVFDELEADPSTPAVMDGPLEPSTSTTNAADVNFFSSAMNMGSSHNVAIPGKSNHSTTAIHPQHVATLPTALPSAKKSSTSSSASSKTSIPENPESNTVTNSSTGLVKPSSFFGSLPSNSPSVPAIPLLQPFPPPNYRPAITREKVKEALQMLVQDNQFIDIVYRAVVKAHGS